MKKLSHTKIISLLLIASLLTISLIALPSHSNAKKKETKRGFPAFIFSANDINGNKIDLANYVGKKLIIVNFWATWCPPCRFELPGLIKLQNIYKDKIQIIGVSLDRSLRDIKNFKENKPNYPIIWDSDNEIAYLYGGIASIPTTFIINKDGKIVERLIGARTFEYFEDTIKKYLPKN